MNLPTSIVTTALVWGSLFITQGQETDKPTPATPTAAAAPESTPATTTPTAATNAALESVFSDETLRSLGIDPNTRVVSVMTNRLDVMDSGRNRVTGGLVPVIKRPALVTFFQLFNPFAPAEYGGTGEGVPLSGFSRAFADPIKSYPTASLISVGGKPEKSIARQRADNP